MAVSNSLAKAAGEGAAVLDIVCWIRGIEDELVIQIDARLVGFSIQIDADGHLPDAIFCRQVYRQAAVGIGNNGKFCHWIFLFSLWFDAMAY